MFIFLYEDIQANYYSASLNGAKHYPAESTDKFHVILVCGLFGL